MELCHNCGSRDRQVIVTESVKVFEMRVVRQKAKGYHRFKKYSKHWEKIVKLVGLKGKL